jgi:putative ABC transport system substrate-binding protein
MDRREALAILAVACAGVAQAQDKAARRVGVIAIATPPSPPQVEAAMAPGRELGWIEGKNLTMERLWGGRDDVDRYAAELVQRNVDLILALGIASAAAAKRATSRIPIVMVAEADPVANGLVASLAHPGGNVTGVAELADVTDAKRLELLRDLLPGARRVGVVVSARAADSAANQVNEAMYASFGMSPVAFKVDDPRNLPNIVNDAAERGMQALMLAIPALIVSPIAEQTANAAIERKLPIVTDDFRLVAAGALASLGNDFAEQIRTMWFFIDRILRGAKPADLPVQQPSRFVMAINAKTATALGVTVPRQVLQRANQVYS